MAKVMRYDIADYLNVSATDDTADYKLMGAGFNTLDESPNAQTDSKIYINNKTATNTIKGYETQFAFDADMISDEACVMALYKVGRDHLTGSEAEKDYVRVDLYNKLADGIFAARKFRVAVECSSFSGAGGEVIVASGNLNCVGDPIEGYFEISTRTFTSGKYTHSEP